MTDEATTAEGSHPGFADALIEQFSLAGRVAVITGAAGGIGRQAAITFAQAGADVVIADVGVKGLEGTAALVAEAGGTALVVPTDVSDRDAVEALGAAALDAYGFHWPHLQMMRGAAAEVIVGRRSGDAAHHRRAVAEYFGARAPCVGREPGLAPWLAAFEADMCQISFGQTTRPAASTRP